MERKDFVVIGSGPAGLSAAYTAGELGLDVLILERGEKFGGFSNGGNGVFAVETQEQKAINYEITAEGSYKDYMELCHYMADAGVVKELFCRSAQTLQWLKDRGVKFEPAPSAYCLGAKPTWHKSVEDRPDPIDPERFGGGIPGIGMLHLVYEEMLAKNPKNIELRAQTRAKGLLLDDSGAISGVVCESAGGEEYIIETKAALIATGGFAGDPKMVEANTKYTMGETVYSFGSPTALGDGVKMAWGIGAAKDNVLVETIACMAPPFDGPGGVQPFAGVFRQPILFVNLDGERFMNEETYHHFGYAGNAVFRQRGHTAFSVLDGSQYRYYEDNLFDYQLTNRQDKSENLERQMRDSIERGCKGFFIADSIEELAAKTGIDADGLKATVAEYNEACRLGYDEMFMKDRRFLRPLTEPKYYAAKLGIGTYGSMGGIKINRRAEVVSEKGPVIKGLYAAGFDANNTLGDTFPFEYAGIGSAFSYTFGRIAGENAAKYCGK